MDGKGLYVRHPPEDHDKSREASAQRKKTGVFSYRPPDPLHSTASAHTVDGGAAKKTDEPNDGSTTGKLVANESLKSVLTTFGLSDADIETVIARTSKD